ncbi:YqeG family HAD IIIA-type phosphatase [Tuberibacillus sp. Marseille-P3662]|uniref:YqeG family HAD IIIA-type phosphatase n=1 Tax=Tuberibacillus sp. Marseille-P3662 TaxID=1965358 RepID=UPI000A1CEFF0|nr:YqeG family HAD IIIA-type phosphatase [Tuberibacillus sp. Marseille-P3662]
MLLNFFLPDQHVNRIIDIQPEELRQHNIKGIVTDLDNTLVAWDEPEATPELRDWFELMQDAGITITIVSNNSENRVKSFCHPLGIPFISKARKPMKRAIRKAVKNMGFQKDDIVVIGDQLLTDILGGNRLGVHTILVVPIKMTDGWTTRINRKIERRLFSLMRKNGLIDWEEE